MIRWAQTFFISALGIWVGGMATLAFIVAPSTFRAAPSRAVAGTIFGAVLQSFGAVQIVLALVCLAALVALQVSGGLRGKGGAIRIAVVTLMLLLVLVGRFAIGPAIAHERETVANFDSLPAGVPQKARFDALHRRSVQLAGATLILGLGLLGCSVWSLQKPADGS